MQVEDDFVVQAKYKTAPPTAEWPRQVTNKCPTGAEKCIWPQRTGNYLLCLQCESSSVSGLLLSQDIAHAAYAWATAAEGLKLLVERVGCGQGGEHDVQ